MFDKVLAPELIPSIFQKFIRVYMHEHDLQEEELLLLYIEVTSFFLDPCSVSLY
jgi:kinetochore-associated protein 1